MTAAQVNPYLQSISSTEITDSRRIADLISRPEVGLMDLLENVPRGTKQATIPDATFDWVLPETIPILPAQQDKEAIASRLRTDIYDSVEIAVKYKGYIER